MRILVSLFFHLLGGALLALVFLLLLSEDPSSVYRSVLAACEFKGGEDCAEQAQRAFEEVWPF